MKREEKEVVESLKKMAYWVEVQNGIIKAKKDHYLMHCGWVNIDLRKDPARIFYGTSAGPLAWFLGISGAWGGVGSLAISATLITGFRDFTTGKVDSQTYIEAFKAVYGTKETIQDIKDPMDV